MISDGRGLEERDDVVEVLRRARGMVARPGGWRQGRKYGVDERVCAIGAIDAAIDIDIDPGDGIFDACYEEMRRALPGDFRKDVNVMSYNDTPGRTQAEIVSLFDRAITARGNRNEASRVLE